MGILHDLIHDDPSTRDAFVNGVSWHLVEEAIEERIGEDDFAFGTTREAWDFLCDNAEHAPDLSDVGMSSGSIFELVEAFAARAAEEAAREEAQAELSTLQSLVDFAEGEGYEVQSISTTCALGWMAHESEEDWTIGNGDTASLHTWRNVEGEPGARYIVVVSIEGGRVWLELSKDEDEEDEPDYTDPDAADDAAYHQAKDDSLTGDA